MDLFQKTSERAKEIIEKIIYITIATVTPEGKPWNSPVYSAYDEKYNFYWASWTENMHSKNIAGNPNVFLVIYDPTIPEGMGKGVYIQAQASVLENTEEISRALELLYGRKNKKPRAVSEFTGDYPRRIYKATPEKIWMNTNDTIQGNFVDKREEIVMNELLK